MSLPILLRRGGWLLAPVLLLSFVAFGPSVASADDDDEPETEMARHMLVIEDTLRLLRRSYRDPEKASEALEQLATMQQAALSSKALVPVMAESIPEAERAAFVTAYRKEMVVFLQALLTFETAVLDGDTDAAKAAYKVVKDMEESGHERFTAGG